MPLKQYNASSLISNPLDVKLSNISLQQGQILFNGGYKFNFAAALSGVTDVQTKNYSNLYLTPKNKLSTYLQQTDTNIKSNSIITTIAFGESFVTVLPLSSSDTTKFDYYYDVGFSTSPTYNFEITFINEEYCTISYDDNISLYYLVLDGGVCKLKKALLYNTNFTASGSQFFKYLLNDDKIFLFKPLNALQLTSAGGKLSAISTTGISSYAFRDGHFTINNIIDLQVKDKLTADYINYYTGTLNVDLTTSELDLPNNFLLHRNLNALTINDVGIISLKNQMSEDNRLVRGNTLSLSSYESITDLREYTTIFNDIDTELDEGLELNYITYNNSIKIVPGFNEFTTDNVMTPFTQININDTKFIESGAFPFNVPAYSDKVYYTDRLGDGSEKKYLCTWLSGSPFSNNSVWVDRYYYPDLITKRESLSTTTAYNTTYNTYLEQLISSNASLSGSIAVEQVFDKKSDMVFKPSTRYIYERFDIDKVSFDNLNIYGQDLQNYYTTINNNGGFTLKCTLIAQLSESYKTISSKFNGISGYTSIKYNNTTVELDISLYDQSSDSYTYITDSFTLVQNIDNNIILNVDSTRGIIQFFVNGDIVSTKYFYPQYYKLLYGDFYADGNTLIDYVSYLDDVFLSVSPLPPDDVVILSIKDFFNFAEDFTITLPCGMRNAVDSITQLNTFTTNQKSKSNSLNLNISNLGITDETILTQIKDMISVGVSDLIPVNSNINQINIIT
jgi:hypothetical protein